MKNRIMKIPGLIVYASKYGSTGEYAAALSDNLSFPAKTVEHVTRNEFESSNYVVLGSPVYGRSVLRSMEQFMAENRSSLANKMLAAFVVCGDIVWKPITGEGGFKNLEKLTRLLPHEPFAAAVFGGRMRMKDLDAEDHQRIVAFYRRLKKKPLGFDRMDFSAVESFAAEIRKIIMMGSGLHG